MTELSRATRAYIATVVLAALAVAGVGLSVPAPVDVAQLGVYVLLAALADSVDVPLGRNYYVSLAPVVHVATVLLFPPPMVVLIVATAALADQVLHHRRGWAKTAFNVAHHVLVAGLPALLIAQLDGGRRFQPGSDLLTLAATVVTLVTYYLADVTLLSLVIGISGRMSPLRVWRENNRGTLLLDGALLSTGALLAGLWTKLPLFTPLVLLPMAVNYLAFRTLRQVERETRAAVILMADAIDDRDPYTSGHCRRVGEYAAAIGRALGLSAAELEQIALAGRVHDLGKIGVSDFVLQKPSPLTPEEWQQMARHPEIGATILGRYSLFAETLPYVRHHHEALDGSGYPDGLVGDQIPLGARVVAVADAYDAMTTDRPYRKRLPRAEAVRRLRAGAGRLWDPVVVEAFLRVLGEDARAGAEGPGQRAA